jgi:D-lyxose ketol-isomerase
MIGKAEYEKAAAETIRLFEKARIALTEQEKQKIEVADFGLNDLRRTGLEIVTYINTPRVCAKEMVLFPHQTCPEHRHPSVNGAPGKEETFRCRYGTVYLYVAGEAAERPAAAPPKGDENAYTVYHEIRLLPGEQHTIGPDTLHWFTAGSDGAVVSEFSTHSSDESDVFTDRRIHRLPVVGK